MALNADTGNELWRYQEEDFIFQAPSLFDKGMIVVTQNGIKVYQTGENTQVSGNEVKARTESPSTDDALKVFEGQWGTPGSDELAINITFTDDKRGVITYYNQGLETPIPFKFVKSSDNQLMTVLGSEEKALLLTLYESGALGYKTNELDYNLRRSSNDHTLPDDEEPLLSGFKGRPRAMLRDRV